MIQHARIENDDDLSHAGDLGSGDSNKEHLSESIQRLQTTVSAQYTETPSEGETINASHTEILMVPARPGISTPAYR